MKFKDFPYTHLSYEEISEAYEKGLQKLEEAKDPQAFRAAFDEFNRYRGHVETESTLVSVRHSVDTSDEFYKKEQEYWDETGPLVQALEDRFYSICLAYPEKEATGIPDVFFKLASYAKESFSEEVIPDLQEENKIINEYDVLKASARIEFDGEIHNLASLGPKLSSVDRDVRRRAYTAVNGFYAEHEGEFDDIYDRLVKVRTRIAHKLGYPSFTELGYKRMDRFDYNEDDVARYRKMILEEVVPLNKKLYESQAKRLGLPKLSCYDESLIFADGNPLPKGNRDELVAAAAKMYHEMSPETDEFFTKMCEMDLFDLETKPNKQMGGYCTGVYDYGVPFIFSNFNGTRGDVDVLTHEAGHAFQMYQTRKHVDTPDLAFPTYESCEIHSMSMEFFAHPWMEYFFKEDKDKYLYTHIREAFTFLPYGCLVDHFQHEVYRHPEYSCEERKQLWRSLEKQYKPLSDYSGFPLLEKGGFFYRQGHIFSSPFYYIDYTLAQVCALQFFKRMLENDPDTWKDYLHLCSLGGTMSFVSLVKEAGLRSPFEDGCLTDTLQKVGAELSRLEAELG